MTTIDRVSISNTASIEEVTHGTSIDQPNAMCNNIRTAVTSLMRRQNTQRGSKQRHGKDKYVGERILGQNADEDELRYAERGTVMGQRMVQ